MANKKEPLAKRSEIVAEIRRYFESTYNQTTNCEVLYKVTLDMLKRTEKRLTAAEHVEAKQK